jgi:outer membrane protein
MKIVLLVCTTFICSLALPVTVKSQTSTGPMKFSLNEAKQYALSNSPVLLNSTRDVEIARKKVWETTASGLPQASLEGSYSHSPELSGLTDALQDFPGFEDLDPNDFKTNFFASITVSQLIFSGQYLVGLKAAKVYKGLSELANSKSEVGISESITTTYFTALIAQESKTILDSSLRTVEKTLYETEQLYKNGFVEATDVDQLKIMISNIKSNLSVSVRQIELMYRLLKFQMGVTIDRPIELTDRIELLIAQQNLQADMQDTFRIENNIDYRLLLTQEQLAKLNMQQQKSQFLPVLSGFYKRYEDMDNNFFNDESKNLFGLSLSFPLFSSGQRISQVQQMKLEYMKAQTETKMGTDDLLIQYETSLSEYLSARDVYNMRKESRDLAYRIYNRSIKKFTEGVGSSIDLNQTQSQFFEAESNYFSALMSLVTAKSKLETLFAAASK